MTGLVFDDSGRAWSGNSAAFAQAFAATASHDGPAEYALHTLGFAAIDIFGRSAQIRFTPARVHDNAIDAAFKWLAQRSFRRIALAQFDGTWRYFAAKSLDTAIACAVTAINDAPKTRVPDLMQRAQPLSQLSHNSPMHGLLAEWKAAGLPLEGDGHLPQPPVPDGTFRLDTAQSVIRWTGRNLFNHHSGGMKVGRMMYEG